MRHAREYIRRSSRFVFVLLVLLSAFVFAMFQGGYVSWAIFYALFPFVIYSIALFIYPIKDLNAERIIRTPNVQHGGKLIVLLTIKRRFPFPLLYSVVSEKWHDEDYLLSTEDNLKKLVVFGFRKSIEWEYEVDNLSRGEHVLEGVEIEVSDFFGWIKKTHFIPIKNTILVFPKMTDIHFVPIDTHYERGTNLSPYNLVKDTTMATGIRDYQSGDRVSWIHWKSFARTQTLMTKEFEDRRSQDLLLVFDSRPSLAFEEQVMFAASILKEALADQAGIGFLSVGLKYKTFPAIQSEEQFRQVLIHLAKIKPVGSHSTVLSSEYRSGTQQGGSVVLITGSPDWPYLQSIISHVAKNRSIVCFIVIKEDAPIGRKLMEDMRIAKSKGIKVHVVSENQFLTAFKGVTHR